MLRGAGGADKNFAYALGLAGVTKLRFEPGFERDELDRFFTVLVKNAGDEDELLTQLWATPLPHLKWSSASAIDRADPDGEIVEMVDAETGQIDRVLIRSAAQTAMYDRAFAEIWDQDETATRTKGRQK